LRAILDYAGERCTVLLTPASKDRLKFSYLLKLLISRFSYIYKSEV